MKFFFYKYIVILVVLILFGCDRQRSGEVMTIGMDEVTAMLKETGEAIDESLATIEESQLSISDRYQLTAKAAALLRQQNNAYAFLCDGELSQAIAEAESLRVGAARLAERVELCCDQSRDTPSSISKTSKDYPSKKAADIPIVKQTHSKVEQKSRPVSSSKVSSDKGHWSWKITGQSVEKWLEREIRIQPGVPVTITVYKNNVETPVVWTWTDAIKIQEGDLSVRSEKTGLSQITITRQGSGKGIISFYPKGHPEQKQTIKLLPE